MPVPAMQRCLPLAALLGVAACGDPSSSDTSGSSGTEPTSATSDPSNPSDPSDPSNPSDPSDPSDPSADSTGSDPDPATAMCERWHADRMDLTEGTWTGSVASCDPGDVDASGRDNALRVVNLYRWLADLPPIEHDAERNAKAQQCALMMTANMTLSHGPTPDWLCYSAEGAEAAGSSNIATGPGVSAVDLYMMDPGNPDTIGHRRWILSNSIGPTGLGSTDSFSCLWTIGGSNNLGVPWVAYPPPGPFPLEATTLGWTNLDMTGWSIQSDTIDLTSAQALVTKDGADVLPMTIHPLGGGYGSSFAISMIPMGWAIGAGEYHVVVSGVSEPIEYDVQVVSCL